MQLIQSILGADFGTAEDDEFTAAARRLSQYRRKAIERLTLDQLPLRRAAYALRRRARGPSKLGRRLRRRNELGRAGSF